MKKIKLSKTWLLNRWRMIAVVCGVGLIGVVLISLSHADSPTASVEAENGNLTNGAAPVSDNTASGNAAVKFNANSTDTSTPTFIPAASASNTAPSGYSLAFDDEFNGSSVDSSKWNEMSNSNYGASNHEDECYETNNITESGGTLNITADDERSSPVTCGGANPDITSPTTVNGHSTADNYFFTSGFLTSRSNQGNGQKYAFHYGYTEAAIEMPKGNPFWGAFWLVGGCDPSDQPACTGSQYDAPGWPNYGEFDIVEAHGIYPDTATGTIHYPGACPSNNCNNNNHNFYNLQTQYTGNSVTSHEGSQQTSANYSTYTGLTTSTYVRYGFLWEPNRITFYVNGYPLRTLDTSGNLTVYSAWDGNGNPTASNTYAEPTASPNTFSEIFSYYHTIDLNLSVGGAAPIYNGYAGIESPDGTSYIDAEQNTTSCTDPVNNCPGALTTQSFPGATMKVDYVRVYQQP